MWISRYQNILRLLMGYRPALNRRAGFAPMPVKKTNKKVLGYLNREEMPGLLDALIPSWRITGPA